MPILSDRKPGEIVWGLLADVDAMRGAPKCQFHPERDAYYLKQTRDAKGALQSKGWRCRTCKEAHPDFVRVLKPPLDHRAPCFAKASRCKGSVDVYYIGAVEHTICDQCGTIERLDAKTEVWETVTSDSKMSP